MKTKVLTYIAIFFICVTYILLWMVATHRVTTPIATTIVEITSIIGATSLFILFAIKVIEFIKN